MHRRQDQYQRDPGYDAYGSPPYSRYPCASAKGGICAEDLIVANQLIFHRALPTPRFSRCTRSASADRFCSIAAHSNSAFRTMNRTTSSPVRSPWFPPGKHRLSVGSDGKEPYVEAVPRFLLCRVYGGKRHGIGQPLPITPGHSGGFLITKSPFRSRISLRKANEIAVLRNRTL